MSKQDREIIQAVGVISFLLGAISMGCLIAWTLKIVEWVV